MESINRDDYYSRILIDVRETFIGYGRYLEKNNIIQDDIDYYERYLQEKYEAEECKKYQEEFHNNLPPKTIEYTEFLCFILKQSNWDNELVIIKQEEWDKFYNSDDYEMKMNIVQACNFYKEFEKLTGTDMWQFEHCFVSARYINDKTYNTMNLIIKIDGEIEKFVIDVV